MTIAWPAAEHMLTSADLAAMASGGDDGTVLNVLAAAQLTKRMVELLAAARTSVMAASAVDLLAAAQRAAPESVRPVLTHPFLDVWAVRQLTRPASEPPDAGYLAALAAAAAIRAGLAFDIACPVRAGRLVLPTLGSAQLGDSDDNGLAVVRAGTRGCAVTAYGRTVALPVSGRPGESTNAGGWQPLRTVSAWAGGLEIRLNVDDADPFRGCYHCDPAGRLDDAAVRRLADLLQGAWLLVASRLPGQAHGMAAILRSLVPLVRPAHGETSATSRRAFGAIGLHPPSRAHILALLLVHEFMHVKLGAVLDLVELVQPGAAGRYYAPWRPDPRPAIALLQGVYAHLGVVQVWQVLRDLDDEHARHAEAEFAYWRLQTGRAAAVLADCGELTTPGEQFATGIVSAVRGFLDAPVTAAAEAAARRRASEDATEWAGRIWPSGGRRL